METCETTLWLARVLRPSDRLPLRADPPAQPARRWRLLAKPRDDELGACRVAAVDILRDDAIAELPQRDEEVVDLRVRLGGSVENDTRAGHALSSLTCALPLPTTRSGRTYAGLAKRVCSSKAIWSGATALPLRMLVAKSSHSEPSNTK